MTTADIRLDRIGQLAITVRDRDRAVGFYRDKLGMRFLFEAPPQLAFFDCGGVRLMLAVPEKPDLDHPSSVIYFRVDDIEAAYRELVERGVSFESEPLLVHKAEDHELWIASFRDSEDNLLALMSERSPTPESG